MLCAQCHIELTSETVGGLSFERCGECRGLFLATGQLAEIIGDGHPATISELLRPVEDHVASDVRHCPACLVAMNPFKSKATPVVLDACAECDGLWLDHGELSQIDGHYDGSAHGPIDVAALRLKTLSAHLERRQNNRYAKRLSEFEQDRAAVLQLAEEQLLNRSDVLAMLSEIDARESKLTERLTGEGPTADLHRLRKSGLIDDSRYQALLKALSERASTL